MCWDKEKLSRDQKENQHRGSDQMKVGTTVKFRLGSKKGKGEVVKDNNKTVIVKLSGGATIKRHKEKHNVEEV